MLTRLELRRLGRARLADAEVLYRSRRYDGAIYICGYTVEAALKARICRTLSWLGYPDTRREFQDYASFRVHNLDILLHLSGIEPRIRAQFLWEWSIVSEWNPEFRYQPIGQATRVDANSMIEASRMLFKTL